MSGVTTYTIYGYDDVDGCIATAICLRHLEDVFATSSEAAASSPLSIVYNVQAVPRPKHLNLCLSQSLRTHYKDLHISERLICQYSDFIDLAALAHKNISTADPASYLLSSAIKLNVLFHPQNLMINKSEVYKLFVYQIAKNSCVEDLFDVKNIL